MICRGVVLITPATHAAPSVQTCSTLSKPHVPHIPHTFHTLLTLYVTQVREKDSEGGAFLAAAREAAEVCAAARVPLVINDRVDVALALGPGATACPVFWRVFLPHCMCTGFPAVGYLQAWAAAVWVALCGLKVVGRVFGWFRCGCGRSAAGVLGCQAGWVCCLRVSRQVCM